MRRKFYQIKLLSKKSKNQFKNKNKNEILNPQNYKLCKLKKNIERL